MVNAVHFDVAPKPQVAVHCPEIQGLRNESVSGKGTWILLLGNLRLKLGVGSRNAVLQKGAIGSSPLFYSSFSIDERLLSALD